MPPTLCACSQLATSAVLPAPGGPTTHTTGRCAPSSRANKRSRGNTWWIFGRVSFASGTALASVTRPRSYASERTRRRRHLDARIGECAEHHQPQVARDAPPIHAGYELDPVVQREAQAVVGELLQQHRRLGLFAQ